MPYWIRVPDRTSPRRRQAEDDAVNEFGSHLVDAESDTKSVSAHHGTEVDVSKSNISD